MRLCLTLVFLVCLIRVAPSWGQLSSYASQQLSLLNGAHFGFKLLEPIRFLLPAIGLIPSRAVENCYDRRLNDVEVDIFQTNITTFQVLLNYYKSQPTKDVTLNSVENLLSAARVMSLHVAECVIRKKSYKVGFTSMSDMSAEEFGQFMGGMEGVVPADNKTSPDDGSVNGRISSACYPPNSYRPPARLNWADQGLVTPVRHQGQCGSCWAFAAVAALESAYLWTHRRNLDLSEQQLVDCVRNTFGGGCKAGTSYMAFRQVYTYGLVSEKTYPYRADDWDDCHTELARPVAATLKRWCIRGLNNYGYSSDTVQERVTDSEIERAVAYHGPISVCLNGERLQHYKSGIFDDDKCSTKITHMVLLYGYTSKAWLLKNSWGVNWGNRGHFQVARRKNMCGINFEIAFPLV